MRLRTGKRVRTHFATTLAISFSFLTVLVLMISTRALLKEGLFLDVPGETAGPNGGLVDEPTKKARLCKPTDGGKMSNNETAAAVGLDFAASFPNAPSCSPVSSENVAFTLVTHLSENRIWIMEEQCRYWNGPISIAVTSNRKFSKIFETLTEELHCSKDQLSLEIIEMTNKVAYPVNKLRNLAIQNVRTSHFVIIDIDFMISESLERQLHSARVRKSFSDDPKLAAVIPAFQLNLFNGNKNLCRKKEDGRECLRRVMPFHFETLDKLRRVPIGGDRAMVTPFMDNLPAAHGSTNYTAWFLQSRRMMNATDNNFEVLEPIKCIKSGMYEPYLALRYCRETPPFQEQFRGYGKNKVSWLYQVRRSGYIFQQLTAAFITHCPHKDSKARKNWLQGRRQNMLGTSSLHAMCVSNDVLFVKFWDWLQSNIPDKTHTPDCLNFMQFDF